VSAAGLDSSYAMPAPQVTQLGRSAHRRRKALGPVASKNIYYEDTPKKLTDELWEQFRLALTPLVHARKLAAVHFQFAPWVAFHPKSFEHVDECQRQLPEHRPSIEFRNETWFEGKQEEATPRLERERRRVNVSWTSRRARQIESHWEAPTEASRQT
jgi:uncharacterized protein YecE (DUF72 family)